MEKPIYATITVNKNGTMTKDQINTDWMIVLYKGKDGKKHILDCADTMKAIKKEYDK